MSVTKTASRKRATEQALDIWAKQLLIGLIPPALLVFTGFWLLTPEF